MNAAELVDFLKSRISVRLRVERSSFSINSPRLVVSILLDDEVIADDSVDTTEMLEP